MKGLEKAKRRETKAKQKEFIKALQLEYLTQRLRSFIYDDKYSKVAFDISEKKRKKIIELGEKFGINTIFSDCVDINQFIKENFWRSVGVPNFQYKDEEQARVQGNYDFWYLFYRGTKVIYLGEEFTVLSNNPSEKKIYIENGARRLKIRYENVTLINNFVWK